MSVATRAQEEEEEEAEAEEEEEAEEGHDPCSGESGMAGP